VGPSCLGRIPITLVVGLAVLAAGCAADDRSPLIAEQRIGLPTGPNAAMYFTATGSGKADRLLGARSDVATSVEIHETTAGDDGTMGMQPLESVDLTADSPLVLEPGGLHLMLVGVDRLRIGEFVEVTLDWEDAGDMIVTAEVVAPGDVMEHEG
jgi:periplasmic copper chaperone A